MKPNKPAAANPAIASLLHAEHHWRGVADPWHDTHTKNQHIVLFALCCMLTACDRRSDASSTSASYSDSMQAQQDNYDRQAKRADEQLGAQEEMLKRGERLLAVQEQLLKRQQDDCTRFEKILDTWESQQKQYQKYLDSLTK